jgi:metal-sulfur cluster biosynthetic enzyme/Fe-S cluster assembly iron-binding protein IscA
MAVELTAASAGQIRRILADQGLIGPEVCLRVGVNRSGHGPEFTLDLAQHPQPDDSLFESHGVRVACAPGDLPRVDGFRIDFREASGVTGFVFVPPERHSTSHRETPSDLPPPRSTEITEALREVIDPEVGINIVDLGLIYGLDIDDRKVHVTMTMTTPACPLGEHIKSEVHARIMERCPSVTDVEIQLVWDPPWRPERISHQAKKTLGWSR